MSTKPREALTRATSYLNKSNARYSGLTEILDDMRDNDIRLDSRGYRTVLHKLRKLRWGKAGCDLISRMKRENITVVGWHVSPIIMALAASPKMSDTYKVQKVMQLINEIVPDGMDSYTAEAMLYLFCRIDHAGPHKAVVLQLVEEKRFELTPSLTAQIIAASPSSELAFKYFNMDPDPSPWIRAVLLRSLVALQDFEAALETFLTLPPSLVISNAASLIALFEVTAQPYHAYQRVWSALGYSLASVTPTPDISIPLIALSKALCTRSAEQDSFPLLLRQISSDVEPHKASIAAHSDFLHLVATAIKTAGLPLPPDAEL